MCDINFALNDGIAVVHWIIFELFFLLLAESIGQQNNISDIFSEVRYCSLWTCAYSVSTFAIQFTHCVRSVRVGRLTYLLSTLQPNGFVSPRKHEDSRADLTLFNSPATSKSHSLFTIAPSPKKSNTRTSTSTRTICSPGKLISPAAAKNTWCTEALCAELKRLLEWLARESYIPTRELYHLESRQSPSKPSQFPPSTVSASVPSPALGAPPPLCRVLTLAANGTSLQKPNHARLKRPLANATGSSMKMNALKRVKLEPASLVPGMAAHSLCTPAKPTAKLTWPFTEHHPEWVSMLRNCLKWGQTNGLLSGADFLPRSSNQSFDMFSSDESEREWLLEEGYVRGESLAWRLIYKRQQDNRLKQAKKSKLASSKAKSKEPGGSTWR